MCKRQQERSKGSPHCLSSSLSRSPCVCTLPMPFCVPAHSPGVAHACKHTRHTRMTTFSLPLSSSLSLSLSLSHPLSPLLHPARSLAISLHLYYCFYTRTNTHTHTQTHTHTHTHVQCVANAVQFVQNQLRQKASPTGPASLWRGSNVSNISTIVGSASNISSSTCNKIGDSTCFCLKVRVDRMCTPQPCVSLARW